MPLEVPEAREDRERWWRRDARDHVTLSGCTLWGWEDRELLSTMTDAATVLYCMYGRTDSATPCIYDVVVCSRKTRLT